MATFTGTAGSDTITPALVSGGVTTSGTPVDLSVNDSLFGLGGNDTLDGGTANDYVDGGDGADAVAGGVGDDTLLGGNVFSAADGNDDFFGNDGNDLIQQVGFGDDVLGGSGNDFIDLDEVGAGSLNGQSGIDTLQADGLDISGTTVTAIESLWNNAILTGAQLAGFSKVGTSTPTFGTTYTYTFTNTAVIADFTGKIADGRDSFDLRGIDGLLAADRITFDAATTARAVINGYEGNDILTGGGGGDDIIGDEGADTLAGRGGNDELRAGDVNAATDGADTLDGGDGDDLLRQLGLGDTAVGGTGDDYVDIDEAGVDSIAGGSGDDTLQADGLDISTTTITGMEALANNAILTGAQLAGFARVGTGTPTFGTTYSYAFTSTATIADFTGKVVDGRDSFDLRGIDNLLNADRITFDATVTSRATIQGFEGNDTLTGGGGADTLHGQEGADILAGGAGNDVIHAGSIYSGDAADNVAGGAGNDAMYELGTGDIAAGDDGDDYFNLDADAVASIDGGAGTDRLEADGADISGTTITSVENLDGSATLSGAQLQAFTAIGTSTPTYGAGYTLILTSATTTVNLLDKVADDRDSFTITGRNGVANIDRITFDANRTASAVLRGYQGNDTLFGGGGRDTVYGDGGSDTLRGNNGDDALYAGWPYAADDGIDLLNGLAGSDSMFELGAGDTAFGGVGDDFFDVVESGVARLDGGGNNDRLQANGYDISGTIINAIETLEGNAILTGAQLVGFTRIGASTPGSATSYVYTFTDTTTVADFADLRFESRDFFYLRGVDNVAVDDRITFRLGSTAGTELRGYEGNDTLIGGSGIDTIYGDEGGDVLSGGGGNDVLYAGAPSSPSDGVDTLTGGNGNDALLELGAGDIARGGNDDDLFNIDESGVAEINGGGGIDTLVADGLDLSATVLLSVENLAGSATLTGAQLASFTNVGTSNPFAIETHYFTFTNTATVANFTGKIADQGDAYDLRGVDGAANNDRITFDATVTTSATINGFEGDDTLTGGAGIDAIQGDEGSDLVRGLDGDDFLFAGSVFAATDAADTLEGGDGDDQLGQLGLGDTARGGAGADLIDIDESGLAAIDGGSGIDTLVADGADLSATVLTGVEILANGASLTGAQLAGLTTIGTSTPFATTTYSFTLTNTAVAADFTGKVADDNDTYNVAGVSGVISNDTIIFDGTSIAVANLRGFEGNDTLVGGSGADTLTGDAGLDRLEGRGGDDLLAGGADVDTFVLAAFGGNDRIGDFVNGTDRLGIQGFGAAFDTAGEVIAAATQVGADTVITLANPGGAGVTVITIASFVVADLNAADFAFIAA